MQATEIIFLLIIGIALCAFLGYHDFLIYNNTTTNETFKWKEYEYQMEATRYQVGRA